jgi:hypothetical protein
VRIALAVLSQRADEDLLVHTGQEFDVAKFDISFDYLELLDVTPAEVAPLGIGGLRDLILKKKKEWTSKEINPLYQQEARASKERILELEKLLKEPDTLTAYLQHIYHARRQKQRQREEELRRLVALAAAGKKEVSARQRELLKAEARTGKMAEGLVDEVLKSLGLVVRSGTRAARAKPTIPRLAPALDRAVLAEINNWLKVLGKPTLYSLLELPHSTPPGQLVNTARILYAKWSKLLPKTSECTAWEKTLQACLTYLKDEEGKQRYDRALFNQRVDQFVQRIDLVLAGTVVGKDEQIVLTRLGMEDFGLSASVVRECLAARAAEKGVHLGEPAAINIQLVGQIQCRGCFTWNDIQTRPDCRNCGSSLSRRCHNPACQGVAPSDARVCPQCRLVFSRGRQYVALLELADISLSSGNAKRAQDACELARRILPGSGIDQRIERAHKVRVLLASVRESTARKAWSRVFRQLEDLMVLAPRVKQRGIPTLESVTEYMASARTRMEQASAEWDTVAAVKVYLGWLAQWTDCEEAYQHLRRLGETLEEKQSYRLARQLNRRLRKLRPQDAELLARDARLAEKEQQLEGQRAEKQEAHQRFATAVQDRQLYAAEKALKRLNELSSADPEPAGAAEVRNQLDQVRAEVEQIKRVAAASTERDPILQRYRALLDRCRDCREALLALQHLAPDPPAPPRGLIVRLEGQRRCLSWETSATGKSPSAYVVQRSTLRLETGMDDGLFKAIYEGAALQCTDEEIVPCGTTLCYSVHAVLRGRLEVAGSTLQEYAVASPLTAQAEVLVCQEVQPIASGSAPSLVPACRGPSGLDPALAGESGGCGRGTRTAADQWGLHAAGRRLAVE